MKTPRRNPVPGFLSRELEARDLSAAQAARDLEISRGLMSNILNGRRDLSTDIALRLEHYLGIRAELLLKLQLDYNLHIEKETKAQELKSRICA